MSKRVAWWWLRLVVSLVRVAVVAVVAWYAWRLELVALLPFPDYRVWTFEYVAWVSVVFAALFTLSLPGFIVVRALRGAILSGAVVALPLGLFALYMSLAHRMDVFLPRTSYFVASGWHAGNTVPWLLGGFVGVLHLGWIVLGALVLARAAAAVRLVHLTVVVPARLAIRLVFPAVLTWLAFQQFFGGPLVLLACVRSVGSMILRPHPAHELARLRPDRGGVDRGRRQRRVPEHRGDGRQRYPGRHRRDAVAVPKAPRARLRALDAGGAHERPHLAVRRLPGDGPQRARRPSHAPLRAPHAVHQLKGVHEVLGHRNGPPVLRAPLQRRDPQLARLEIDVARADPERFGDATSGHREGPGEGLHGRFRVGPDRRRGSVRARKRSST